MRKSNKIYGVINDIDACDEFWPLNLCMPAVLFHAESGLAHVVCFGQWAIANVMSMVTWKGLAHQAFLSLALLTSTLTNVGWPAAWRVTHGPGSSLPVTQSASSRWPSILTQPASPRNELGQDQMILTWVNGTMWSIDIRALIHDFYAVKDFKVVCYLAKVNVDLKLNFMPCSSFSVQFLSAGF